MPKPLAFIISGSLAAVAIAALSVLAAEEEGGLLDRSALANLSGAPLEPTTTGSVLSRDDTSSVYRKRVEHLDKQRLGHLTRTVAPARSYQPAPYPPLALSGVGGDGRLS